MSRTTVGLSLTVFLILSAYACAQELPSSESIVQKVQSNMSLDPGQFDKVKAIIEENMAKRQEIVQKSENGRLSMAESQSLDGELYGNLSQVLAEFQMEQWNKIYVQKIW